MSNCVIAITSARYFLVLQWINIPTFSTPYNSVSETQFANQVLKIVGHEEEKK